MKKNGRLSLHEARIYCNSVVETTHMDVVIYKAMTTSRLDYTQEDKDNNYLVIFPTTVAKTGPSYGKYMSPSSPGNMPPCN